MSSPTTPVVHPPFSGPAPRRRALRWTVFLALAACMWVLLFKGCAHFTIVIEDPKPEWSSRQPGPPPGDFRFLAFPVLVEVDLYDAPGGSATGKLSRAVGMSVEEERGEWVRVAGAGFARRADLMVAPPAAAEQLTDAYEAAMKARPGIEFVWAGLTESTGADGLQQMTFRESFDDYANISTYRVTGTTAIPLAFARDGIGNAIGRARVGPSVVDHDPHHAGGWWCANTGPQAADRATASCREACGRRGRYTRVTSACGPAT